MSVACQHRSRRATNAPICGPMRKLIPASVLAVSGAAVVLYAIALGTDGQTGRYSLAQTIALVFGFLTFVGGARHLIGKFSGAEA